MKMKAFDKMALRTYKQLEQPKKRPWYEIFETDIAWRNVIIFLILHGLGIQAAIYLIVNRRPDIYIVGHFLGYLGGFGITGGAHRLWCHRAYKAKFPLRVFLMIIQTFAFQNSIYEWCRDHRVHHKFTDTHADPHNSRRGVFFSHMGWLLLRKHKDVKERGKLVDMSDLEKDSVVMWQKRYYLILMPILTFVIPTISCHYVFNVPYYYAFITFGVLRYLVSLHITWLINSAGHFWGSRPFDKGISGADNKAVAMITQGEGWHNYHHVFPWDYKAAELGSYEANYTNAFIDFFAKYGLAYDLKTVTDEMIIKRVQRTGDGTHPKCSSKNEHNDEKKQKILKEKAFIKSLNCHNEDNMLWGWEDVDMPEDDKRMARITGKKSI